MHIRKDLKHRHSITKYKQNYTVIKCNIENYFQLKVFTHTERNNGNSNINQVIRRILTIHFTVFV